MFLRLKVTFKCYLSNRSLPEILDHTCARARLLARGLPGCMQYEATTTIIAVAASHTPCGH